MDINQIIGFINGSNIVSLFFKWFAVAFALIYFIFTVVISKQTQVMSKTVQSKTNGLILFVSTVQLLLGFGLFIMAVLI